MNVPKTQIPSLFVYFVKRTGKIVTYEKDLETVSRPANYTTQNIKKYKKWPKKGNLVNAESYLNCVSKQNS